MRQNPCLLLKMRCKSQELRGQDQNVGTQADCNLPTALKCSSRVEQPSEDRDGEGEGLLLPLGSLCGDVSTCRARVICVWVGEKGFQGGGGSFGHFSRWTPYRFP